MTENVKLHSMGQNVSVPLSEPISYVDGVDTVYLHMTFGRNQSGERILRDLLVDVFPQRWLNRVDSPLTILTEPPFDYQTGDLSYTFLHARAKSAQVRRWFASPGEQTLTGYDPRPDSNLAISFDMPKLEERASAVHKPCNMSWGFSPLPWPNTVYECYMVPAPGHLPTDMPATDAYELVLTNTWDIDDLRTYRNLNAARVELIHGISDRDRPYLFNDMVVIRVIHPDGWLTDPTITRTEVAATVCGIDTADFMGKRVRLHVEEGQHEWGKSRLVTEPFSRMSFSLPAQPPAEATFVLAREGIVLDRAVIATSQSLQTRMGQREGSRRKKQL